MKNFHDLLSAVMDNGVDVLNVRTGKWCRTLVGHQLQYDIAEGFPALTTRQMSFKSVVGELLGFFRGYDSAADFRAIGCKFWDKNANETADWVANPYRAGRTDFLGRIYGKQWTDWRDKRVVWSPAERDALVAAGYTETLHDAAKQAWLVERGINQLEAALKKILTDPSDRRIIVSGWRPDEFDMMALPPCHMDYRFVPFEKRRILNVVMTIRSWDLFLGAPANIASTSLFLAIMARLAGYEPGIVTIQATNAHIYEDHFEQVRELLKRDHLDAPRLALDPAIRQISLDDVPGVFTRIEPHHISLQGYQSHTAIAAPMAA